jgi:hypothetical protein
MIQFSGSSDLSQQVQYKERCPFSMSYHQIGMLRLTWPSSTDSLPGCGVGATSDCIKPSQTLFASAAFDFGRWCFFLI